MIRQKHDFDTQLPDVRVHMTWTVAEGKPIMIRAYAVEASTGIRLSGAKEKKATVNSIEELPHRQRYLVARVVADLPRREQGERNRDSVGEASAMEAALTYIEEHEIRIKPTWGQDYQKANVFHFRRHIMPRLVERGEEWSELDRAELELELTEEVLRSGHSIGHDATATATVRKKMAAGAAIYACMLAVDPSLPDIDISPSYGGRRVQLEQLKSLLMSVRYKLAAWIVALAEKDVRLAAAAALMYACGLRTAEAAAVHLCQLTFDGDKMVGVYVFYQVKDGKRVEKLKTLSSYRCVPLSTWGAEVLKVCFERVGDLQDDEPLCEPRRLSAELRLALKACGVDEDYLAEAERTMQRLPEFDDEGRPILDVSAYILRRDWATRARSICGFTTEEIDYCLGHVRKGKKGQLADLKSLEEMNRLSAMLEHHVVDPYRSAHPAAKPIGVIHGSDLEILPYDIVCVRNTADEPIRIELDITAVLSAESVAIVAPRGSCKDWRKRTVNTKGIRPIGLPIVMTRKYSY